MLLYKHQILTHEEQKKPMLFLGWDVKTTDKLWLIKLDDKGNPVVDWYYTWKLRYIKHKTGNTATPGGLQIVFGKYSTKLMNNFYIEEVSPENLEKFGKYLAELTEKYKTNE